MRVPSKDATDAVVGCLVSMHPLLRHLPVESGHIEGLQGFQCVMYFSFGSGADGVVSGVVDLEGQFGVTIETVHGPVVVWTPEWGTGLGLVWGLPDGSHPDALLAAEPTIRQLQDACIVRGAKRGVQDGPLRVYWDEATNSPRVALSVFVK